jgi:hypothetical protein
MISAAWIEADAEEAGNAGIVNAGTAGIAETLASEERHGRAAHRAV